MIQFFGIPVDTLTTVLLVITAVIVAGVLMLALSNVLFFKIGVRNIFRRRTQMALITFALMLSTMLLSCILAVGDVMTATVQSVAVYNWGNIDELIEGGRGPLGTYPEQIYYRLVEQSRDASTITSVGAALQEDNLLVADQTSRQVRSTVTALAVLPDSERGFGGMQDVSTKQYLSIASLQPDQVYLNQTIAQLLNAKPGDVLYLYSPRWPGRRYTMRVAAIIDNGGLVGDNPYIVSQLQTFQGIEKVAGQINRVFIANRGGGGVNGVDLSDQVTDQLHQWLPRHRHIHVIQVKAQGVQASLKAQDIFSRIFSLFSLFALAIGLLLIFLIFVLLAAERRGEMGMARAIGMQRYHLVLMYLFEGSVYDLFASLIGLLFGLGISVLLVNFLEPILARFNFPLKFTLQPHSLIVAYCLGVIFTFCSVALSCWLVSRMTVVEAMRDLPEPNRSMRLFGGLRRKLNNVFAILMGSALVAYWALPIDVLARLGLPHFRAGIEVFFVAGMMMVLGAAWVLISNAGLFVSPLLALSARLPGLFYTLAKLASVYPLHRRFRTGLNLVMFSLVVFAMTVMSVITNAMQNTYVDINTQTGGYDIQATPYFKSLPDLHASLAEHGIDPNAFSAIGMRSTTVVGVIQLSAPSPRWYVYPVQIINGGFLQGYGLHLVGKASGFDSDSSIWQALQSHPDYALIDSSALSYSQGATDKSAIYDPTVPQGSRIPPGFDPNVTFAMSGVSPGEKVFPAVPVWVADLQGRKAIKLTIIGVVDNSDSAHFGLYIPHSRYSSAALGAGGDSVTAATLGAGGDLTTNADQSYYFKVAPGQDKRALALQLGSAFLDYGLETTVLEDVIWQKRGPRIFLSDVLLGVVGMTLLLGVAALAVTGTRAVIERRQQIGMLRALGCSRRLIQSAFLLESFLVGLVGSILGMVLGLILARNIFAVNFFEQYQTGLTFSIPWQQLALIVCVSVLASLLGAVLPAWQAGRVTPIEALRYS